MTKLTNYLSQILFLVIKELRALLKDPSSRALLVTPALMQSLLFGYGATYDLTRATYAVLDQSHGHTATQIFAHLNGTGVFRQTATLSSADQIAAMIDGDKALLVISVPEDFERRLAAGEQAPLQVILDGRNSSTAGLAAAYISSIVSDYNASLGVTSPITVVRRVWFNANLQSRWTLMPALIAGLSMMQTLLLSALSVAREREQGTFDQLLVTPLTPMQILIGKALPSMLIGMTQSTIIFLIILFWFQIPMNGSVGLLYVGLFSFTGASVGIGLSVSALSLSMQQAMLYTFMIVMPMMLLSGLLTPVHNMPEFLQIVTYANPLRFGIDIVRRVYLEGAGLSDVALDFVPLSVIAIITLPLASWLFRNRLS